jgi:hypothetical protein
MLFSGHGVAFLVMCNLQGRYRKNICILLTDEI